ncbi:hypothetical protein SISSUDRAFT_74286 [Sistotremastrum suecicum HHB10207 ss-3]|uniref:Uncharacterized protein n=1 Tax=Sistotremastrum suecicum HHB10207 ss-3 TaxID=1314776 RepID=A0A166BER3_9AGAM|nr:hypothetical protein SISSUDRAFT_74286 [Sistotremastrum suecicum HHB10207 ss-3]
MALNNNQRNSQIGSASVRSGSGGSAIVGGGERSNAPPVPGTRPMSTVQNPNRPPVPGSYPQTPNLNPHPGQQAWKPQTMVRLGMKQEVVVSFEGTSQYASGGPSTCGLASMNAVRVVMGYAAQSGAMDAGALIERIATSFCLEEIMAICALWPDPAHLEVENIRTLPLFRTNLEHVDSANETLTTDGFRSLLFRLQSFSTNHPNPRRFSAVVITRPPEIVALIHIPISDNHMLTSCFALFDSHPRPNKGTKGASWVLFGSLEKCVDYLAKELFFFDAGLLEGVNEWQAAMFSQFAGEFFIAPPMPTTGVPTEVQATYEANLELFKSLNDNAELQASVKELTRKLEEEKGRAKTAIELAQHEKSVVERKLRVVEREKLGLVANLRTKEDEVRMLGVKNESLVGEFGREKEEMQGIIGQLTEGAKARDMANIQAGRALSPRPLPLSPAPTIPLPVPTVDEEELREAQDMLRRLVDEKRILESRLASHNPDHITFTRHQELLAHQKEIHDLQLRLRDCEGALVHMTEMRDVAVQERERVRGDARSAMGASETLIEKLTAQCDRQLSIIEAHGHAHTSHPPPPPAGYPLTPRYSTDHLGSHILPSHSTSPSEDTMVLINSHTSARREAEDKLGEVEDSLRSIRADNESALDKLCESEKVVQELTEERDKLLGEIEELKNSLEKKAGMKEELSRAIGEGAKAESEVKQLRGRRGSRLERWRRE